MAKSLVIILLISAVVLISGCVQGGPQLTPKGGTGITEAGMVGTEIGTGWSINEDPEKAVKEALEMALEGKIDQTPEFAIVFATSGSDLNKTLSKARELLGEGVKIYGGTSDSRGVMTEKGFLKVAEKGYVERMGGKRGLAIMTISSNDIEFGVGSANYSAYSSVKEAAKAATIAGIENAGKTGGELPDVVLITPTLGLEDEAIAGVEEVIGKEIPILGGTTGGPEFGVFGKSEIYDEGITLAFIYTDLPMGIIFEGGFDATAGLSGIVTKVDGQGIVEIDNRPALDVYNEWLGGEIDRLFEEVGDPSLIRDTLTLHPLYRKFMSADGTEYRLFSHPWPKDDTLKDRTVMTSTNIKVGDRVYLSQGAWETLLNRIGNSPTKAKKNGNIDADSKPLFGIGIVCAGVLGTIPEEERPKMPVLINYANKNAPFIATFTWGEQGYYPGLGNKHGNLQTGFLVVGPKK
jgi:hypothetical protein